MDPNFERYRQESKGNGVANPTVTARVPEELKKMLDFIAEVEGDNTAGLIVEGVARVVENRLSDNGLKELERKIDQQHLDGQTLIGLGLRVQQNIRDK